MRIGTQELIIILIVVIVIFGHDVRIGIPVGHAGIDE